MIVPSKPTSVKSHHHGNCKCFQTGQAPVESDETLEIMAFMQAALLSEQENRAVELSEIHNTDTP